MRALLLAAAIACAACGDTTIFDPMKRQPKFRAFAANPQFEDGRAMRQPPEGTVSRERQTMRPEITMGRDRTGQVVSAIPIPVTKDLMLLGRTKFEVYCGICHGLVGDGVSLVATQMSLRPPPNLHQLRNPSPGHVFQVVSEGFGLMPSYAAQLTAHERWAVVAYLTALRRSQAGTLADAPADIQQKLRAETQQ
jgi:mono/diheme cytochrome c family protein